MSKVTDEARGRSRRQAKGIVPWFRRNFMGQRAGNAYTAGAKTDKKDYGSSLTTSKAYKSMPAEYRWFRQDELVRKCVVTNAFFSCLAAGFQTEIEVLPDKDGKVPDNAEDIIKANMHVKHQIDLINRQVNLDQILFNAQVKRSVFGKAAWEVVYGDKEFPDWLLALRSDKIKPVLDTDWTLLKFSSTQDGAPEGGYSVEDIFYFTNLELESDREGISDIEPILGVCQARYELMQENFPEIVRTCWAPYVILQADTSLMPVEDEDSFLLSLADMAQSGKSLAVNHGIEVKMVSINIDFTGLIAMLEKFEEAIHRQFGTPRFLVGKPIENRATAYAELEAYVDGQISSIQRYLKREVERQWYSRWTKKIMGTPEGEQPQIRIVHKWNKIRTTDVYEMAKAAAALWGAGGMGVLGLRSDFKKIWDMMGWDQAELDTEWLDKPPS